MFKDEDSLVFKSMCEISTAEGFVKISEKLADMIKFVANEPSVGLFYVQQHTQKAVPNLINLKNNVVDKSHETALHTEDMEDSIMMIGSMKECGFPIADEMITEIKKSLSIISTKQPKKGLLNSSSSGFLGRTSSWSPANWGRSKVDSRLDIEKTSEYLSGVFTSTKQRARNIKWPQVVASNEASLSKSSLEAETEELRFSSQTSNEIYEEGETSPHEKFISFYENYDEFKADKEAKFEEWLGGRSNEEDSGREMQALGETID